MTQVWRVPVCPRTTGCIIYFLTRIISVANTRPSCTYVRLTRRVKRLGSGKIVCCSKCLALKDVSGGRRFRSALAEAVP